MEMPQDYIKLHIKSTIKDALRRRSKQTFPCPDTLDGLRAVIEAQDPQPACNCDQCDPRFYKSHWNCKIHPHDHPKLKPDSTKNEFGNQCYKPLKMNVALRAEAMELTRTAVKYFDRPLESLNNTQLAALMNLQIWVQEHMSLFFAITPSTPSASLDTIFPESSMRELWKHINILFFGSDIPRRLSCFRWATTPLHPRYETAIGVASVRYFRYSIVILPSIDCILMLSTLLHEACHIFLRYYACQACWSTEWNLNTVGHRRAWQVLASAVERKFVEFTGLPADLGRLDSLRAHWDDCWPLPSIHELADWQLDRPTLMPIYVNDLHKAVRGVHGTRRRRRQS